MSQPWQYIQRFGVGIDDGPADAQVLGGKGAGLATMGKAGLPIPPGFTIITECCAQFLQHKAWPPGLESELEAALIWLESVTGRQFGIGAQPLLVSVRSGAARSMPGMMDTILNVGLDPKQPHAADPRFAEVWSDLLRRCPWLTSPNGNGAEASPRSQLRSCIETVWRSWDSPRAHSYRQRHQITGLHGTAVNVQAMFPSQVSGVVFTRDPQAPDADEMIVEAAFGLGESVVSGDVTPDHYRLSRDGAVIRQRVIGHKGVIVRALGDRDTHAPDDACLNDSQLAELARICIEVESMRGDAVDVEFGYADGRFALLQSRPIRGLDVARAVEPIRNELIDTLRARSRQRRLWVRHNLDETLQHPTPMTWDLIRGFMSGEGGFGRLYATLGYRSSATFRREGFLDCLGGRIYADPQRAAGLFWDGLPLTYDLDLLRHDPRRIEQPPTRFVPEESDATFLLKLPANLWAMARAARRTRRLRRTALARFRDRLLPSWLEWVKAERARDLATIDESELIALLEQRRHRTLDVFGAESLMPGFFGGLAHARLTAELELIFGPQQGRELALELITGLDDDITLQQSVALADVAAGKITFAAFLDRFGHRCLNEMELAEQRWSEDASYIERLITQRQSRACIDPRSHHQLNADRRAQLQARLPDMLATQGASSQWEHLQALMHEAQALLPWRENAKFYLMQGYALIRQVLVELGRRWDIGADVFSLQYNELPRFSAQTDALRAMIAARRIRREAQRRLAMPTVIDSDDLANLGQAGVLTACDTLQGEAISPGVAEGVARTVLNPAEVGELGDAPILVCPSTDPAWTPLFAIARGLVMERGGVLSHGAIVARDFGLPAVVCPDATRLIADGRALQIDGTNGRITLREAAAP